MKYIIFLLFVRTVLALVHFTALGKLSERNKVGRTTARQ